MRQSILRDTLRWSCVAVPTAGLLVAVAAAGFAVLGKGETGCRAADLAGAVGFLSVQTLGPIAIWVACRRVWACTAAREISRISMPLSFLVSP